MIEGEGIPTAGEGIIFDGFLSKPPSVFDVAAEKRRGDQARQIRPMPSRAARGIPEAIASRHEEHCSRQDVIFQFS